MITLKGNDIRKQNYISKKNPSSLRVNQPLKHPHINGLVQDCSNSTADALEFLQSALRHQYPNLTGKLRSGCFEYMYRCFREKP